MAFFFAPGVSDPQSICVSFVVYVLLVYMLTPTAVMVPLLLSDWLEERSPKTTVLRTTPIPMTARSDVTRIVWGSMFFTLENGSIVSLNKHYCTLDRQKYTTRNMHNAHSALTVIKKTRFLYNWFVAEPRLELGDSVLYAATGLLFL